MGRERRNNYAIAAAQARRRFPGYDHSALARKLGVRLDGEYLYPEMLRLPYRICRSTGDISRLEDGVWTLTEGFNECLTLLDLVCDSREDRCISGRWKSMGSFAFQFHTPLLEGSDPCAQTLQAYPAAFDAACRGLHGEKHPLGDCSYVFPLFEGLGVLLKLTWGDDEFPAGLHWFWDENALQYLRYETMHYATGMIRARIAEKMRCPAETAEKTSHSR